MDSMRHLSTSLPHNHRRNDAPELLAEFKNAALSVTNLYKAAAAAQSISRDAGYQDALDDLLAFLDRKNLGLMDGEGWQVRQWATERLDGSQIPDSQRKRGSDDETEEETVTQRQRHRRADSRSSSPEMHRKAAACTSSEADESAPPPETTRVTATGPPQAAQLPSADTFTFRSTRVYPPTNHDRGSGMELDSSTTTNTTASTPTTDSTPTSIRVVPRRSRHRHNRRGNNGPGSTTLNFNLGTGAGSKRKLPYPEYFDISGFGTDRSDQDGKDGGDRRGGKRGRHV